MKIIQKQLDGGSKIQNNLFETHINFAGKNISKWQGKDIEEVKRNLIEQFKEGELQQLPVINGVEYYFLYW